MLTACSPSSTTAATTATTTATATATATADVGRGEPGQGARSEPLEWRHRLDSPGPKGLVRGQVESIIDGDTITVTFQSQTVTVRLLGIDTPEKPGGPRPAECFGQQASAFARELLPVGSSVVLSRDQETRDQYGRLLAWVHRDDGVFINLAMVESGHATALFFAPNDELEPLFEQAAWAARREQLGFWPACGAADVVLSEPPA